MKIRNSVFFIAVFLTTTVFLAVLGFSIETVNADAELNIVNEAGYLDVFGYYRVLGELENVGDQAVEGWEITTFFYNSSDDLIHTVVLSSGNWSSHILDTINPGRKSPFETVIGNATLASEVDHYSVTITSYNTATAKPLGLEILGNSSRIDAFGNMIINGTIKNTGAETAESVNIIATYYDSGGNVIAVSYSITEPSNIEPGLALPFQTELASIGPYRIVDIESYVLEAESSEYVMVPEFPSVLILPAFMMTTILAAVIYRRMYIK